MIADTKAEDEFWRSIKPLQTLKNTGMGYSAAYPTMRRRSSASEGSLAKGEPEGTARGRARSVVFFSRSRESKSNRGKFSLGWGLLVLYCAFLSRKQYSGLKDCRVLEYDTEQQVSD